MIFQRLFVSEDVASIPDSCRHRHSGRCSSQDRLNAFITVTESEMIVNTRSSRTITLIELVTQTLLHLLIGCMCARMRTCLCVCGCVGVCVCKRVTLYSLYICFYVLNLGWQII